jgi:DNA repair exonuclease SbcCD ATPase subunit
MKIKSIELTGFRGFAGYKSFDLDADAIIVVGANGRGKTSLFDGILWALTGEIPRIGKEDAILSKYSESGEAHVSITMRTSNNQLYTISRSFDGENQQLRLDFNGEIINEPVATIRLFQTIWPEALLATNGALSLTTAITRSVYLQQDLVRQFIEADTDKERFESVSELVGGGRVNELQLALERARNAWSRSTTSVQNNLEEARSRLYSLRDQLNKLASSMGESGVNVGSIWTEWWRGSLGLGVSAEQVPDPSSSEAPFKINEAIKRLEAIRRSTERRRTTTEDLLSDIRNRSSMVMPDEKALQETSDNADKKLMALRQELAEAESQAAEERRRQVELRESHEELRTIAELALRHLGPACPVCGQEYDRNSTRQRLEKLIGTAAEDKTKQLPGHQRVVKLASLIKDCEKARADAHMELRSVKDITKENRFWLETRDRRLRELEVELRPDTDITKLLSDLGQSLAKKITEISLQQEKGEEIALMLARASEVARRDEIANEIKTVGHRVDNLEKKLKERDLTSSLVTRVIDGLRDASYFVVDEQLRHIGELLQWIYSTIDPHPSFRTVRFLSDFYRGRGILDTEIKDSSRNISSSSPQRILSSSQMNALAVSVFLAFNLSVKSLPIQAVILDDPLQSLDDVNLLGVIDLLRRVREKRQLFVSTHDSRFGQLLERKLRPVRDQRTVIIKFTGWDQEGPSVDIEEKEPDSEPMRIPA